MRVFIKTINVFDAAMDRIDYVFKNFEPKNVQYFQRVRKKMKKIQNNPQVLTQRTDK